MGLLIEAPFPRDGASAILLTIDLTSAVVEECLNDHPNVGVIIAYHPPIFRPLKQLTLREEKQRIAVVCAAAGISVYSPHTALDNAVGGVNDWLARCLGPGRTMPLKASAPSILATLEGQEGAGSGRLHTLDEPVPLSVLVARIKERLELQHLRLATNRPDDFLVSTVGICAGSGGSVLAGVNADLMLTGEMGHHEVLAMLAAGVSVILCEHSNSERGRRGGDGVRGCASLAFVVVLSHSLFFCYTPSYTHIPVRQGT